MMQTESTPVERHPGVQGMAQIGRNAIDRIIELERARARDEISFRELRAERDELLRALWGMVTSFHGVEWMEPHMRESADKARAVIAKMEAA
jgi:hypothetical protein